MRTTEKFDRNGSEIFEGDKIIKSWGWWRDRFTNKVYTTYRIHTIRLVPVSNEDEPNSNIIGGVRFIMGTSYNIWSGNEVRKITLEEINQIGVKEDVSFFYDDNGKSVLYTDQHLMQLNNEEWDTYLKQMREREFNFLFGETKP